ncbi:hypothetical protein Sjap_003522 [Stephania japonica]|uniref:Receptor-like serine/threonine-protein kinase n=1 Tax=Stephania japonica TaxID=461633 RepID=A0AAP0KNX6_9MAGN
MTSGTSAADTMFAGQSLTRNQTLVSSHGKFELGFFTPGNSQNYYIGIWFKQVAAVQKKKTIVWVANRNNPIATNDSSSSEFKLLENGYLVILISTKSNYSSKVSVWSTDSASSKTMNDSSVKAVLGDDGNLVVTSSSNRNIIWQSFDHPTHAVLPGAKFGYNNLTKKNHKLTAWENSEDPSEGIYSLELRLNKSMDFTWNHSLKYYTSGVWNGRSFSDFPEMVDSAVPLYAFMDTSGQMKTTVWQAKTQDWIVIWIKPMLKCQVYGVCGAFSVCGENNIGLSICQCLPGFEQHYPKEWGLLDYTGGCMRQNSLQCGNKDSFSKMPNIILSRISPSAKALAMDNAKKCELTCLQNCSCNAYSYFTNSSSGGSIRCLLWWRRRLNITPKQEEVYAFLTAFKYKDLKLATKNFSNKLGSGSFGSVYKGTLPDLTAIAVKRLEGVSQDHKQFRSEVSTIGLIHHINLVRLRGFCSEGRKKMLVYDLMPNGSLEKYLNLQNDSRILNWQQRYQIATGVARGLAYLHEKCRDCIIHCDIKPENVLLDADFSPRIADFGLAKLLGREFSRVMTTMRGTIGYLAPEWISGVAITAKADVYSYGMLLFEIISGRRNFKQFKDGKILFFPTWASRKVIFEGQPVLSVLDNNLKGNADIEELNKAFRVACWCIQEKEYQRPSMGQVVRILEGFLEVNPPPILSYLQAMVESEETANFFS